MAELRAKIAKKASKILEAQAELPKEEALPEMPESLDGPAEEPAGDKDLSKKFDELSAKIDSLAEALEQLIVIEEEEGHEDLEELKDKEEEKKDKDVSKDEMGLESPELAASKTAEKTDLGDHNKTIADDFEKDKSDKAQQKLEAPAPQITKVKKSDIPEMLKLADIAFEQKNDKWIVIDASDESNEKPVYEISKGQNGAEFDTSSFVENLIKQMQADGVEAVLQSVGAVEYAGEEKKEEKVAAPEMPKLPPVAPVPVAEKKDEKKEDEKAAVPVVKASDIQRKFVRAFNLAITAMNKNLVNNPLKTALGSKLDALGMEESEIVRVVESVFKEASRDHFATALAQTEKYMSMSDEAFVETESMIQGVNVAEPTITASQRREMDAEANDLRVRASRGSLPVTTATEHSAEKRDLLGAALPKPANWAKKDTFRKVNK